jgi:hypothetical protein
LDIGVPRPTPKNVLHITMFHINRASVETWKVGSIKPITITPENMGTAIILRPSKNLFVLGMANEFLLKRRQLMSKMLMGRMENPENFHMTLSYDVGVWKNLKRHQINFPITIVRETNRQPRM